MRRSKDGADLKLHRNRPNYRLPAGFQMLFYGNGRPISVINHWLANMAKAKIGGGKRWDNTQSSYADDAAQGTIILFALGKTWDDLSFQLITQMAAALMVGYSVWTRKKRDNKTIARRIGTFLRIAKHARKYGYPMDELPHEGLSPKEVVDQAALGLNDFGSDPEKVMPPATKSINVNPILQCGEILKKLGPEAPLEENEKSALANTLANTSRRNRLSAETSLYTGLRVDEVAHLTVAQILFLASEMQRSPRQKEFALLVEHTKGTLLISTES